MSIAIGIAMVRADGKDVYFQKFEGYIPSGIGARSVPVSRLAGRLAGKRNFIQNSLVG